MTKREKSEEMQNNFQGMIPRSIFAEVDPDILDKKGSSSFTGGTGYGAMGSASSQFGNSAGNNIYRNPSRRFYDPEITTTAIYLPRNIRQKNRWCRWFFDHDETVGAVLELHAELPYSRAEVICDDPVIKREVEDCLDKTNFFSMLPAIDLEFMKIGEVFIHTPWDNAKGCWSHIILHNPDFVEVRTTPFADSTSIIELKPDDELRKIVHSTKPEDQQLKKRLPKDIVRRVLTGKNILLDPDEVTHIARRSNPYDIRGTSMLQRLFRLLMYEDKLREAQITIADNFIYPLKIFKLGDKQKGWIPDESHQRALAQMLQQANFDPNFALIYHYGLEVDYITVAEKVMRLEKEWQEINEKKMIALGFSKELITGSSNYSSANVGLQIQQARYRAKRDLFETRWINDKFFRVMAERNGWYKRDAREIVGQFRVSRKGEELEKRLIMPKLMWHKKLMMRDDQQFLTFLNNVYAQGKGPISAITLLMAMGLDLNDELTNKNKQKQFEEMIGSYIQSPGGAAPGGAPGGAPPMGALGKLKDKLKFGKKEAEVKKESVVNELIDNEFVGNNEEKREYITNKEAMSYEQMSDSDLTNDIIPISTDSWNKNIQSPHISGEVIFLMTAYDTKIRTANKKYNGDFKVGVNESIPELKKALSDLYVQGKLTAYGWTDFLPIYSQHYAMGEDLRDYSDIVLSNEFSDWISVLANMDIDNDKLYRHLRDLSNTCYCFGQLKGFQEQGIHSVKISNSQPMDGIRYTIDELTKKGKNLSSLIAPLGEIVLFVPCIEGFDDSEIGNSVDANIKRYKNHSINGIVVKDCPIENFPFVERYLNKLGKYLKKEYDNVIFVKDVINLPEWEDIQKKSFNEEFKDVKSDIKQYTIMAKLVQERTLKIGKIPVFKYGRTLYISNWIGMEDTSLTENLIKYIPINDESLNKTIDKVFKNSSYDLNNEELNTYRVLGYINPIQNSDNDVIGWKMVEGIKNAPDEKIILGRAWNFEGKCATTHNKDSRQLFNENVRSWIDYPQKLTQELKRSFEEL